MRWPTTGRLMGSVADRFEHGVGGRAEASAAWRSGLGP